jgi:carboxypeptidase Taq
LRAGQWRLDTSPHAFASFQGRDDIRLGTRYPKAGLSLLTSLHEAGHGLYEHNIDLSLQHTPLAAGASASLHESQSRLFENYIGRNVSFWRWLYPQLQHLVPTPFASIDLETYHQSLHAARPTSIRVGSDQVSYLLHIILRFEIELDLIEGRVDVADLPELWNARTQTYLGVVADEDGSGVLQDVHWARGRFGYFPSYALGDVIAGQIWNRITDDIPEIDEQLADGNFGPVCEWLRTNVWRHGGKFLPRELLTRIVGEDADPRPHLDYLDRVFA